MIHKHFGYIRILITNTEQEFNADTMFEDFMNVKLSNGRTINFVLRHDI